MDIIVQLLELLTISTQFFAIIGEGVNWVSTQLCYPYKGTILVYIMEESQNISNRGVYSVRKSNSGVYSARRSKL